MKLGGRDLFTSKVIVFDFDFSLDQYTYGIPALLLLASPSTEETIVCATPQGSREVWGTGKKYHMKIC